MSTRREAKKIVKASNLLLAQELGRNPFGGGKYEWRYSEDWVRPKRAYAVGADEKLIPEYDYVANSESGILEAKPKYITERVCLDLQNQWVMSVWMASEDFEEWRLKYGDSLEWPKHGDYWPVSHPQGSVCLDSGMVPTEDITWEFIRIVRKDREDLKTYEERKHKEYLLREKRLDEQRFGMIRELLPAFEGIPGSRSYPIYPGALTKIDPRISKGNTIWTP